MTEHTEPASISWQALLGYLNFSEGKPDPRFHKQLNELYAHLAEHGTPRPWQELPARLERELDRLQAGGAAAFRDLTQARAVIRLAFEHVLPAYRRHHADLLFALADADLFTPFFLARVLEAVLAQGSPWEETQRIVTGSLKRLNDFVGHRPIAVLETRPKGEPYAHEQVRPIPLYVRGAGVAWGPYRELLERTLRILEATDPDLLADAAFDLSLLDELALDPRAYDFNHPVHRRTNYVFGEWDPHHLDDQGRFRRFVLRRVVLDALLERAGGRAESSLQPETPPAEGKAADPAKAEAAREELLQEAAAVLAGTMLMAAAVSGSGPGSHDSSVTLTSLQPRIARFRDRFYANLLEGPLLGEAHRRRLKEESARTRQPFGAARQHLNQSLARQRAWQVQQRHLAIFFADIGFAEASRREAARIPVASVRFVSEILGRLRSAHALVDRHQLADAARLLPEAEDLLHRGMDCGALADPWNVLGFQGLFALFSSREDSVRDPRIDELLYLMEQLLNLYARLMSESAAAGQSALVESLQPALDRLARWWDRFATHEVGDVRRVHGGEAAASAEHVATSLARWHQRGEASADLAFWKEHLEGFRTAKAFALVVEALLRKEDYRASMALLMNWLGQAGQVPLEEGEFSFNALALRWMLSLTRPPDEDAPARREDPWPLVRKFFDYLEANAEDYMEVPRLEEELPMPTAADEDELYDAAYEGMSFRDSGGEGGGLVDDSARDDFVLESMGEELIRRLRFASTAARLMVIAARATADSTAPDRAETLAAWLASVESARPELLKLLDVLHQQPIPEPTGSFESNVEYDRRRALKERVVLTAIDTAVDFSLAGGALLSAQGEAARAPAEAERSRPAWEPAGIELERALLRGDPARVRAVLPGFIDRFRHEPLLFTSLAHGGEPGPILRARIAQNVLRVLAMNLPRLGLLHETLELLQTAQEMEQRQPPSGRSTSEFNFLFQAAFQGVVETVVQSSAGWPAELADDRHLAGVLENITAPFLDLWTQHSRTLTLSLLETVRRDQHWQTLVRFIQRYGHDLFTPQFLTLANLRSVLHRGVGEYLDFLAQNPDPLHPIRLVEELDRGIPRASAIHLLTLILQLLVENYEEYYSDYKVSCPQSDYGENLHLLLDFLWLKASYERHAWQFRPLVWVHEVLARSRRRSAALRWQEAFARLTRPLAERHLQQLAQMEKSHGMRLASIADRLEQRFVQPLAVDRLLACVGPAMKEAPEEGEAFARLVDELKPHAASQAGTGVEVPDWLRRLEQEAHRVRAESNQLVALVEKHFRIPRITLRHEEVQQQIARWQKPGK